MPGFILVALALGGAALGSGPAAMAWYRRRVRRRWAEVVRALELAPVHGDAGALVGRYRGTEIGLGFVGGRAVLWTAGARAGQAAWLTLPASREPAGAIRAVKDLVPMSPGVSAGGSAGFADRVERAERSFADRVAWSALASGGACALLALGLLDLGASPWCALVPPSAFSFVLLLRGLPSLRGAMHPMLSRLEAARDRTRRNLRAQDWRSSA
ncbi:MAG: hypothetical protein ACYC8T_15575 [Myxococcaceae bacterium]